MKNRTLIITVLLLALALSFIGCGNDAKVEAPETPSPELKAAPVPKPEPTATPEPTPPPFMPLSLQEQNRLYCQAHRFEYEGKIYSNYFYQNQKFLFGCVEKGKSSSEYTPLLEDPVSYCEVIDGKLYVVTCQCEDSSLYRCSLDMSEIEPILAFPNQGAGDHLQYYEGYFYYTDKNNDFRYYRLPIDGTEPELVIDKAVYYPMIHDGWVLYQDDADGESLHWMELSSGNDYKITSIPACSAYLDGEYIYFSGKYENSHIYRIKHDGSDQQMINEADSYAQLGIDENHIYYVKDEHPYYLFRMDKDGSNVTQLGNEAYHQDPYLVDGMIYAKKLSDSLSFFYNYRYLDAESGEYIESLN